VRDDVEQLAGSRRGQILHRQLDRDDEIPEPPHLRQRQPECVQRLDAGRLEIVDVLRVVHVAVLVHFVVANLQPQPGRFAHGHGRAGG
jgi:hypothetical protein